MFLKLLATITLVVPLAKGIKKVWANTQSDTVEKISETLLILPALLTGFHQLWKRKTP